ncbi:MAG TPA: tetratricopeptide repeat protein [Burkholderiales bacterium]|nr:tetratricopeptide repeat protein [Burkholderiales bacterium]
MAGLASKDELDLAARAVMQGDPGGESRLLALCERHPEDPRAHFLLGAMRDRLGRDESSLQAFSRALDLDAGHVQALSAKAAVLLRLGRAAQARELLEAAVARQPAVSQLWFNLGAVLESLAEWQAALAAYDRVLALPGVPLPARMNRGYVLTRLGRLEEALENNRQLAAIAPASADAHFNLAEVLLALRRPDEALPACEQALRLAPAHSRARIASGLALSQLGRLEEARAVFGRVRREDPGAIATYVNAFDPKPAHSGDRFDPELIHLADAYERLHDCDWSQLDSLVSTLRRVVEERAAAGGSAGDPGLAYNVLTLPLPAQLRMAVARDTAAHFEQRAGPPAPLPVRDLAPERRLRIGYLSPDFREHLNAYLLLPLLRLHDRGQFEVACYSVGPRDASAIRQRVQAAADRFVDVPTLDDEAIARAIREDGIDILVDVGGYTTWSRPGVVARRPAPVQAGYLAFPGTQAMAAVPWRIVDHVASPPAQRGDWTEALIRLPDTFYLYDGAEPLPRPALSRAEYGLPADAFVFCGFHNYYKIQPGVFSVWMEILREVPGSVLWLPGRNAAAVDNLRREAGLRGVQGGRLVFAPHDPRERYRARFALADLFLDTFTFNAMTTACDALAAGLPLLTAPGEAFASRVAASLLGAAGFREGIVESVDAYRSRAIEWGRNPAVLRDLRQRRLSAPLSTPLFDTRSRVRQLEQAFREMWRRHCLGLAPESFDVVRTGAWRNPWH